MRQVQASPPCDQKLPSHGGLCVKDGNFYPPLCGNFRRPQSRWSAANHRDLKMLHAAGRFFLRFLGHKATREQIDSWRSP